MKIAYTTTFDAQDVHNWSGTPFYMSKYFQENGAKIEYIGSLKRKLPLNFKLKQFWKKFSSGQRESPRFNITAAKYYSEQTASKLLHSAADIVIAPQINPIAYLDSNKPIVLWTDAVYAGLLGFYPSFSNHSASSIQQGNEITRECLHRTALAIFSSDWAAQDAIELYGADKNKIKVVPFGANLQSHPSYEEIKKIIANRARDKVKFLFLGKHWDRKGGDIVFAVTNALHKLGVNVELNFVGCHPPKNIPIPSYIHCHGFISKRTEEGFNKLNNLMLESHFLFLPSRAEAYGIAFCEANAFGLPVITSYLGGIPTVVKDNINGKSFALQADPAVYCDYIKEIMTDFSRYESLALSAYNEFATRLNWRVATNTVKKLIQEL